MSKVTAFLICLAAAACASYGGYSLRPGSSTEAEVRATMGTPAAEFGNADGTRSLFYPKGPMGTDTFRVRVGADGVMRDIGNVLPGGPIIRRMSCSVMPALISNTHAW